MTRIRSRLLLATACLAACSAVAQPQEQGVTEVVEEVRKAAPAPVGQVVGKEGVTREASPVPKAAAVSTLATTDIAEFDTMPAPVRSLIQKALELTTKNLTYTFGSHDPAKGGMDCSGTVYHVLQSAGVTGVPRSSDEMCRWTREKSVLHLTEKAATLDDPAFAALRPGDLLFWTGTYDHAKRALPVSHVMIYLGKRARDGKPVIFGASDGRTYDGQRRCGVSVFDFKLPKPGEKAAFYGYGGVPGIAARALDKDKDQPPRPARNQ